jgi:hypothetical protein
MKLKYCILCLLTPNKNIYRESIQTIEQPRADKLDGGNSGMDNGKEQSNVK